ncbi:MAG: hypothetical protein ACTS27_05725 [Phycisphaerales bacterium]
MAQVTGTYSPDLLVPLIDLWLPILLAAVVAFVLSFLAWAVSPHHKPEFRKLDREDEMLDAVRRLNIPAGGYMFPYCDAADLKTEEGKRRMEQGPWGRLRVYGRKPGMGGSLLGSFVFYLVVSFAVAYVGSATVPAGAAFEQVLQVLGTVAILAYTAALIPHIIWFERSWRVFFTNLVDGVVFGLATALLFAWMWPGVATPGA